MDGGEDVEQADENGFVKRKEQKHCAVSHSQQISFKGCVQTTLETLAFSSTALKKVTSHLMTYGRCLQSFIKMTKHISIGKGAETTD